MSIKQKPNSQMAGQSVKIIAGLWRSRKINFPAIPGLRPTGARIRETLFNWLTPHIEGANCLDVYAGSGILSLESLSRGAKTSTALESERIALDTLQENRAKLQANLTIIAVNSIDFLAKKNPAQPFDVVFIDPPFNQDLQSRTCALLEANHWLSSTALVYCELPSKEVHFSAPPNWVLKKNKVAGNVRFMLYSRIESAN